MEVTVDTHTLLWYTDEQLQSRLSAVARERLDAAETTGIIYVPIIVLTEILHLTEKRRIHGRFENIYEDIRSSINYRIVPFTAEVLHIAVRLKQLETHDRIILATALQVKAPLISKDESLRKYSAEVVW